MRNLAREIRERDVENRRYYIWANVAAFGLIVLMAVFLLMSTGGAPRTDDQTATTQPQPIQPRPNG